MIAGYAIFFGSFGLYMVLGYTLLERPISALPARWRDFADGCVMLASTIGSILTIAWIF